MRQAEAPLLLLSSRLSSRYMLAVRPDLLERARWVSFGDDDVYYHPRGM